MPSWAPRGHPRYAVVARIACALALSPAGGSALAAPPPLPDAPTDRYLVLPFANRSQPTIVGLEYLRTAVPFVLAEKLEHAFVLEPAYGPWVLSPSAGDDAPPAVAANGLAARARWVITGSVERPQWKLRVAAALWRVDADHATKVAEVTRTGAFAEVHRLIAEVGGDLAKAGGWQRTANTDEVLAAPTTRDLYAFTLFGRGIAAAIGLNRAADRALARRELEHTLVIDPTLAAAHRLLGEIIAAEEKDPRGRRRAAARWNAALELAPGYAAALRSALAVALYDGKVERALTLSQALVRARPFDLAARTDLGDALWRSGDAEGALNQLDAVAQRQPADTRSRRLRATIHAARGDVRTMIGDLESLADQDPSDVGIWVELAAAHSADSNPAKAQAALRRAVDLRPADATLAKRMGDLERAVANDVQAVAWYQRAQQLAPHDPRPSFALAKVHADRGRLGEARHALHGAHRFPEFAAATTYALGVIALRAGLADEAAWYLRRASVLLPHMASVRVALVLAELARGDLPAAEVQLAAALQAFPSEVQLLYLQGVRLAASGDRSGALGAIERVQKADPAFVPARAAWSALQVGAEIKLGLVPELVLPLGDAADLLQDIRRFDETEKQVLTARDASTRAGVVVLSALGEGPQKVRRSPRTSVCPIGAIAAPHEEGQAALRLLRRANAELSVVGGRLRQYDDLGESSGLLPNQRKALASTHERLALALADGRQVESMWVVGVAAELRAARCSPAVLAAASAEPRRYAVFTPRPSPLTPHQTVPAAPTRSVTIVVDNHQCPDPVRVFIDGQFAGEVAAKNRTALRTAKGRHTLCLLTGPGVCGDRGTLRQTYFHDGWTAALRCVPDHEP